MKLPWWMLISWGESKSFFVGGICINHRPSKTMMIFVPYGKKGNTLRYLLLHEWYENQINSMGDIRREHFAEYFEWRLTNLEKICPGLIRAFEKYFVKTGDYAHSFAIAIELALAKREMSKEAFLALAHKTIQERL